MDREAIDLSKANVFALFSKYFFPTLFGMVSMSAVTALDGIWLALSVSELLTFAVLLLYLAVTRCRKQIL